MPHLGYAQSHNPLKHQGQGKQKNLYTSHIRKINIISGVHNYSLIKEPTNSTITILLFLRPNKNAYHSI